MASPASSPSSEIRANPRGVGWKLLRLALGLAIFTGFMGTVLHWSLGRPEDWSARWSADDERTEDQTLHQAVLAHGAKLGPGKIGRAVHLPVTSSTVVLDGWPLPNDWTIELWVEARRPSLDLQLIAGPEREMGACGIGLSNGTFAAIYRDPQGDRAWLSSGIKPSTNCWYHVAATCDGRLASIYVDGVLRSTAKAGAQSPTHSGSGMHLGGIHRFTDTGPVGTNSFAGRLDELSLYSRALSPREVCAIYRSSAMNPAVRSLARDLLLSLSLALLAATLLGILASRWHPPSAETVNLRTLANHYHAAIVVLLVGLTTTGCLYLATGREAGLRDRRRFRQMIGDFLDRFDNRTESYVQHLTALRSWLGGTEDLTPAKWDLMIDSMNLRFDYPGLYSVGFAPHVTAERLDEFEEWARHRIDAGFAIYRLLGNSNRVAVASLGPSNCPSLLPLTLHSHIYRMGERAGSRRTELGRDLFNWRALGSHGIDPTFSAVTKAFQSQEVGAGGPERLNPSVGEQAAVLGTRVYLGVFTAQSNISRLGQASTSTPSGVRKVVGVLFGSFSWQQFFDSALRAQKPEFRFTLFTPGNAPENRFVLAEHGSRLAPAERSGDSLKTVYQSRFYSRRLHFEFETLPAFAEHSERRWPVLVGGIGIALSLGVAGLAFIQARGRLLEVATAQELRSSRDQLRHLLQDRERISRDLHDGAIQTIYGIGLGLKRCQKLVEQNPSLARTQLSESIRELDGTISELRQFILSLEPELPGGESLTSALEALVQRTRRSTNAQIQMNMGEDIETALTPRQSIHLMNLIREGLSNSVRHASATHIRVSLRRDHSHLKLQITDDGAGFHSDALFSSGSGLGNMRARTKELNGSIGITSLPGSGTEIEVTVPLERAGKNTDAPPSSIS